MSLHISANNQKLIPYTNFVVNTSYFMYPAPSFQIFSWREFNIWTPTASNKSLGNLANTKHDFSTIPQIFLLLYNQFLN